MKKVTNEESKVLMTVAVQQQKQQKIKYDFKISQMSVSRTLSKLQLHPYHVQLPQELNDTNYNPRL